MKETTTFIKKLSYQNQLMTLKLQSLFQSIPALFNVDNVLYISYEFKKEGFFLPSIHYKIDTMKTLNDLFEHQLQDLYSAENQLLDALPEVLEMVNDSELKNSIESHKKETEQHKERIVEICNALGVDPSGEECKAMKGLIEETQHFLNEDAESDVRDAGIIANCQRIEHYEISGYGTAVKFAQQLGHNDIAKKLQQTLNEEYEADEKLDKLAENRINAEAKA